MVWRPTDYKEEYIKEVDVYLAITQDEYYDYVKSETEWVKSRGRSREQKIKVKLPTIEGFAKHLWVVKNTIYDRQKKYPLFSDALEKIAEEQKTRLLENGLNWNYNPTIAKLVLSANHWMSERVIQEQQGKDGWPIQVMKIWKSQT